MMVERKSTIRDDIIAVRPLGAEALWHGNVKDKGLVQLPLCRPSRTWPIR
jgi:hypothetical protein